MGSDRCGGVVASSVLDETEVSPQLVVFNKPMLVGGILKKGSWLIGQL